MDRTEPLQVVIQMWQVDKAKRRPKSPFDPLGRFRNPPRSCFRTPLRGLHTGSRSPKGREGKLAQVLLYFPADRIRPGVNVEDLPPIGWVHRARRNRVVNA